LTPKHFENRHALYALLFDDLLEDGRFKYPKPDPKPNAHHDDAEEERDPPSPDQELIPRQPAEAQNRRVRQEQPRWRAELGPGADEAAVFVGLGPFHCQQNRAAPFAADADALDQTNQRQENSAPDADAVIGCGTWLTAKVAMPVTNKVAINVVLRPMRVSPRRSPSWPAGSFRC
jgi:hypothetical protein